MNERSRATRGAVVLAALTITISTLLALSGCGAAAGGGDEGGGGSEGGGNGGGDGSGGSAASYAITDLCAQADLSPLQAVLPVVKDLEPQSRPELGYEGFFCAGVAGTSDAYDGVGFVDLAAFVYEDPARAAEAFVYYGTQETQAVPDLGAEARSYVEHGLQATVEVLDGALFFTAHWSPNTGAVPDAVLPALVESVRATLPNLRA